MSKNKRGIAGKRGKIAFQGEPGANSHIAWKASDPSLVASRSHRAAGGHGGAEDDPYRDAAHGGAVASESLGLPREDIPSCGFTVHIDVLLSWQSPW